MEYESRIKNDQTDKLCEALLALETMEECYRFIEDVFTIKEIETVAQRLEVAKLLKLKKTYSEIEEATGASTATISRVNRTLNYGADGYKMVFEKLGYKY